MPQENNDDSLRVRRRQNLVAQHKDFIRRFPFDVINLDLEEFLFKPNDPLPGKVVNALRRMFDWQSRGFVALNNGAQQYLDGFSLMFTTRIGPENISEEYLNMLKQYLEENLHNDNTLLPVFQDRTGGIDNVADLQKNDFDLFFRLCIPKVLSSILIETDWYIDPETGVSVYEFERTPPNSPPYKMLHLVMDVKRQLPHKHQRPPGIRLTPEAQQAYKTVVHKIFSEREACVTLDNIEKTDLEKSLAKIIARRRLYCPDDD